MNSKTKSKPSWLQEMTEVETKQAQADFCWTVWKN
jgi:hypothetical protein